MICVKIVCLYLNSRVIAVFTRLFLKTNPPNYKFSVFDAAKLALTSLMYDRRRDWIENMDLVRGLEL